ncbi:hypothetical protein JVU11DRAFT_100 [Chiua virens]|nr:hypothetical protein JVU11DRAFT_100 [Chiua virens]
MSSSTALKTLKVFDFDYAYLDSGAPASPNYTTWVILHGMGFNGVVFEKILPLAHAHNLRVVSVNRRGYEPSSGFAAEELEGIGFGKKYDEAEPFYRGQGIEIATFLTKFATQEGISPTDPNGSTGGIALIGWSLASIHVLTVLAYVDALAEDTRSTLQKYLHTGLFSCEPSHFIFADASAVPLGIPNIKTHDVGLWFEPDDRKRFDAFFEWATAHYVQKSVTSENIDDYQL